MTTTKSPTLLQALIPLILLIIMLFVNVQYFDDALGGSNQFALLTAATLCIILGFFNKVKWENIQHKIISTINSAMPSILILFFIGSLSGTWMISGIIPTMIYYGVDIMHPSYFLVATVLLCSIVSVSTGSSWSTVATIGVAIIGIGNVFGLNPGLVAGAIISGAYFGDKMSPLSDTTNLASAVAGTDIFTHIRYMMYTTGPAYILTIIIFTIIGLFYTDININIDTHTIKQTIQQTFNVSPFLLAVPVILIILIIKKVPSIPAMIAGTVLGIIAALIFQQDLFAQLIETGNFKNTYELLVQASVSDMNPYLGDNQSFSELFASGGMSGMLNTIWLILAAMIFGGTMEACGFLRTITLSFLHFTHSRTSLIGTTLSFSIFFNITSSDQYLAIVIPGKMLHNLYNEKGYKPEVLSRALEDSATVTSVLIPWNTCGATQARVLGVATMEYLPYCFFNILSPCVNIFITAINYKIRQIHTSSQKEVEHDSTL